MRTRKRVVHVKHARTNRSALQKTIPTVSAQCGGKSPARFTGIAGTHSISPTGHCYVGKTAQTRGELSPSSFRGGAGGREFPSTLFLRARPVRCDVRGHRCGAREHLSGNIYL